MAEFINTADVIGDEILCGQFIDRSITEYKDNTVAKIPNYAFMSCTSLTQVNVPNATEFGSQCFSACKKLVLVDAAKVYSIEMYAFQSCTALKALILRRTADVCGLGNANAVVDCCGSSGIAYVYVPRSLVDSYKAATNWSTYADRFRALEDYTVDGTITGDLDESKI